MSDHAQRWRRGDRGVDRAEPGARLVIVDTFEKMRGRNPQGVSAYTGDYAAAGRFKTIADNYGVPFLLIHHVRKQGAEDWQDLVSGTNGLTGAVDATLVLERSRGQADGVLHVTGRDVVENDYAMTFDGTFWTKLDGPAADYDMGDTRALLLRLVREYPGSKPAQLAEALDKPAATVRKTLTRMAEKGQVRVTTGGAYSRRNRATSRVTPAVTRHRCHTCHSVTPPPLTRRNSCGTTSDTHKDPSLQDHRGRAAMTSRREWLTVAAFCAEIQSRDPPSTTGWPRDALPGGAKLPNGKLRIDRRDIDAWYDSCEVATLYDYVIQGPINEIHRRYDKPGSAKPTRYVVRWTVERKRFEQGFKQSAQADSFRSELVTAARKGEPFDVDAGLPVFMLPQPRSRQCRCSSSP